MALPKRAELEIPILRELHLLGGEAKAQDLYSRVAKHFPGLSQGEMEQRLKSGDKNWDNRVRWARLRLVQNGEVVTVKRGVWRLTDKGRERLLREFKE